MQTKLMGILVAGSLMAVTAQPAHAFLGSKPKNTDGVLIKSGTTINGKLNGDLSSAKNQDGDKFTLTLAPGLFQNKTLKGSVLEGHLVGVKPAAKFGKKGELDVVFDDIRTTDGKVMPISAKLASAPKADGKMMRNLALVAGGALTGHVVGNKAGKKHGALAGAAAGGAVALAMPGGDVVLKSGTSLSVKFTAPLSL